MNKKESKKVLICEDDRRFSEMARKYVEEGGHEVVAVIGTLSETIKELDKLISQGLQIAVLDGNLGPFREGADGQEILRAIKKINPKVKVIGFSSLDFPGADVDLGKRNMRDLGPTIDKL